MKSKNIESITRLSAQQQGMLLDTLSASTAGVHVEQGAYLLRGGLDVSAFERAWQSVADRHAILRTAFVWKNQEEPFQVTFRRVKVPLERHDWRGLSAAEEEERLSRYLDEDRRRGFDPAAAPLMRLAVIASRDSTHRFVWSTHHLIIDGWSSPLVLKDLAAFYEAYRAGRDIRLPPSRPYRDYVDWLQKQDLAAAERFWRTTLEGFVTPTALGVTDPSPLSSADDSDRFGTVDARLPESAVSRLHAAARQSRVTLNVLVQGVWALLLARYSGEEDVVFGTTVSGRPADLPGVESIVGPFSNTLPFRVRVERASPFGGWLKQIQERHLAVRAYEYCSMGQIHQWSEVPGSVPLCESILVFQNYPSEAASESKTGLTFRNPEAQAFGARTKYPLTILVGAKRELRILLVYDRTRVEHSEASRVVEHLRKLLCDVAADPSNSVSALLERIPAEERLKVRPRRDRRGERRESVVAPRTATEARLARIWMEVLSVSDIGVEDDFVELGGHSLIAMRAMSRLREEFSLDLPLSALFEERTIAKLASRIDAALDSPETRAPVVPLRREERAGPIPLSFAQQRLWFLAQLSPSDCAYNIGRALRVSGALDVDALRKSIEEIARRHESLRTTFAERDDEPVQLVHAATRVELPVSDLTAFPDSERESEAHRVTVHELERPFDLGRGPLFRARLVRLASEDHLFVLTMHHIVSDGWSMGLFFRELEALYVRFRDGGPSPLPELKIQYPDYAVWQRSWLSGEFLDRQLTYWRTRLSGAPPVLELAPGRPKSRGSGATGAVHSTRLARSLTDSLERLSRRKGVTLFMTFLAAFEALIFRMTGRKDVVVGTDTANRRHVETEPLIGFFVNLLVLRTDLSGNPTFEELLSRARETALGAYANQDVPFEKVVEELRPERDLTRNPLVQVLIVMANDPPRIPHLAGLSITPFELERDTSRFDLVLFLFKSGETLTAEWLYDRELFDPRSISRIAAGYESLLESIVADPSVRLEALRLWSDEEERQQMAEKQERQQSQASRLRAARRHAVDLSQATDVLEGSLSPGQALPLLLEPAPGVELDLADWARGRREFLDAKLLEHGAVLFRGFGLRSAEDFERFAGALCPELFGEYGDLPREAVGGKVYGSTPYPADQSILFHNESSHMHRWPMKIWFYCVTAAEKGGETPIVDCRVVYRRLPESLRRRFSEKGLMYVRNYGEGLDVSWQSFYGTEERARVEELCRLAGTEFEWTRTGLRTRQRCPAVVQHPQTGEMSFFNQLQLHHVSCLDPAVRESLSSMLSEEEFPRNVYFGDGSRIEDSVMTDVGRVYRESAVAFPWRPGDVLMLNNMLTAHARNPYVGARKIVVAMGEMVTKEAVTVG